jgi:hypothetical protein
MQLKCHCYSEKRAMRHAHPKGYGSTSSWFCPDCKMIRDAPEPCQPPRIHKHFKRHEEVLKRKEEERKERQK